MNRNLVKGLFSGFDVGVTKNGELIGKRIKTALKSSTTKNAPKASFVLGLGRVWR